MLKPDEDDPLAELKRDVEIARRNRPCYLSEELLKAVKDELRTKREMVGKPGGPDWSRLGEIKKLEAEILELEKSENT